MFARALPLSLAGSAGRERTAGMIGSGNILPSNP
jgi:hypothetical protein